MKIVFIGDSHLAGMKLAEPVSEDMKNDFFVYPSSVDVNMSMLEIKDKSLIPTCDRLKEHFEMISQKSEITFNGIGVAVLVGLRMEFPYKLFAASYSKQVMRQAMLDIVKNQSISFGLAEKIRKIDAATTIIVIPNPLISSHLKAKIIPTAPGITPKTTFGYPTKLLLDNPFLQWQSVLEQVFKNIGVHFCFQKQATITDHIFTQPNFAVDPLSVPGIRHMNKAFWEHIWSDLNRIILELEKTS